MKRPSAPVTADAVGPEDTLGLLRARPATSALERGASGSPAGRDAARAEHEVDAGVGGELGEGELRPFAAVPLRARPQVREVPAPDAAHPDELVLALEVGGAGALERTAEPDLGARDRAPAGVRDDAVDAHPGVQGREPGCARRTPARPAGRGDGGVLGVICG